MGETVSVLIPVYNGARYLSACLDSICGQTVPPDDILIVDDGSEDETPQVAAQWARKVRYHRVPHGGLPYARNHALRLATTSLIAFVDCDDLWAPAKLEHQLAALAAELPGTMVFGLTEQFVSEDLTAEEAAALRVDTTVRPAIYASALLMRRSDCDRIGPFDERLSTGEFVEWVARAKDAGLRPVVLPEVVCRRRVHRTNMGRTTAGARQNYVQMLKQVLDRRRERK